MIEVTFSWEVIRPLLLFVLGMVVYSVFIFKFYRFVAKRDIFELNLKQYSKSSDSIIQKIWGSILYVIEYILLFPIFTFFWYGMIAIFLVFLSREQSVQNVLLVSIALVGAIRITAYYNEDLSKDLAKMLPFALLGIFLVDISFFSFSTSISLVMEIPSFWSIILHYLVFVIALEFVLRIGHGIYRLFVKDAPPQKVK